MTASHAGARVSPPNTYTGVSYILSLITRFVSPSFDFGASDEHGSRHTGGWC